MLCGLCSIQLDVHLHESEWCERVSMVCGLCSIQLDGGNVVTSNTCWTDAASTEQPAVVRSALSQTALGPINFGITLQVSHVITHFSSRRMSGHHHVASNQYKHSMCDCDVLCPPMKEHFDQQVSWHHLQ